MEHREQTWPGKPATNAEVRDAGQEGPLHIKGKKDGNANPWPI